MIQEEFKRKFSKKKRKKTVQNTFMNEAKSHAGTLYIWIYNQRLGKLFLQLQQQPKSSQLHHRASSWINFKHGVFISSLIKSQNVLIFVDVIKDCYLSAYESSANEL